MLGKVRVRISILWPLLVAVLVLPLAAAGDDDLKELVIKRLTVACREPFLVCPPLETSVQAGSYGGGAVIQVLNDPKRFNVQIYIDCPPKDGASTAGRCTDKNKLPAHIKQYPIFLKKQKPELSQQDYFSADMRRGIDSMQKERHRARFFASAYEGVIGVDVVDMKYTRDGFNPRTQKAYKKGDDVFEDLFAVRAMGKNMGGINGVDLRGWRPRLIDVCTSTGKQCDVAYKAVLADVALRLRGDMAKHVAWLQMVQWLNRRFWFHCDFHGGNMVVQTWTVGVNDSPQKLAEARDLYLRGWIAPYNLRSAPGNKLLLVQPWKKALTEAGRESITVLSTAAAKFAAIDTAYMLRLPKEKVLAHNGGMRKFPSPCFVYRTIRVTDVAQMFRLCYFSALRSNPRLSQEVTILESFAPPAGAGAEVMRHYREYLAGVARLRGVWEGTVAAIFRLRQLRDCMHFALLTWIQVTKIGISFTEEDLRTKTPFLRLFPCSLQDLFDSTEFGIHYFSTVSRALTALAAPFGATFEPPDDFVPRADVPAFSEDRKAQHEVMWNPHKRSGAAKAPRNIAGKIASRKRTPRRHS